MSVAAAEVNVRERRAESEGVLVIDLNAHVGFYPFRRLRFNTVEGLVAMMDRWGIDRAVVTSLSGLLYRNVQAANEELAGTVSRFPQRLIPVATIDPSYAGWEGDLERVLDEWGMKGVRMMPNFHRYELDGTPARILLGRLATRDVPVFFHESFEDARQTHPWDRAGELRFHQVAAVLRAHPDLRAVYLNGRNPESDLGEEDWRGRALFCFSRMQALLRPSLKRILDAMGAEGMAFGTHAPLYEPATALLKLQLLELSDRERQRVAWQNTAEFLGLGTSGDR